MIARTTRPKKPSRRIGWRRIAAFRPSPRALKLGAAAFVAVGLSAGGWWLWAHGGADGLADLRADAARKALDATARAGFAVREVHVEGRARTEARPSRSIAKA